MVKTRIIPPAQGAHAYPLLIKSLLLSGVRQHPGREIVYADRLRYDYRTLNQRIHRLANLLTASGIGPGDTVALLDWDSHRSLECFFASLHAGGVIAPLNHRLARGEPCRVRGGVRFGLNARQNEFLIPRLPVDRALHRRKAVADNKIL